MKNPKIVLSDGTSILDLDDLKPDIFGYMIVHVLTGRILPGTSRNEVYSKAAAIKKMVKIASQFTIMHTQLDIWDYTLEPIYDFEKPKDFIYFTDEEDYLY